MQLFMNKLMSDKPVAVRFSSYEEAKIFYEEMKSNYPHYVRIWREVIYSKYNETKGGMCYCPYFNTPEGSMTHGSKQTYIDHGIRIVEFSDLLFDDEAEIAESALTVDFLIN